MNSQERQQLLRKQQRAYQKLNEWEANERLQKLPMLSVEDALVQYFQLVRLSEITANPRQLHDLAQVKHWQQRAKIIRTLKDKAQV